MPNEITINDFSPHLFWDVDTDLFELDKYKAFFIQRVLEYGKMKDWNLIKSLYGMKEIETAALNARSLDAVTLSFVSTLFNIEITEFKCYKYKQLFPNYWNS